MITNQWYKPVNDLHNWKEKWGKNVTGVQYKPLASLEKSKDKLGFRGSFAEVYSNTVSLLAVTVMPGQSDLPLHGRHFFYFCTGLGVFEVFHLLVCRWLDELDAKHASTLWPLTPLKCAGLLWDLCSWDDHQTCRTGPAWILPGQICSFFSTVQRSAIFKETFVIVCCRGYRCAGISSTLSSSSFLWWSWDWLTLLRVCAFFFWLV